MCANIAITKYTSQYIDNMSFDDELKVQIVEIIGEDGDLKNPATEENQDPLSKYKITDLDDAGYYGYTDKDGDWYIMSLIANQARYIKGDSNYTTSWTGRAGLSYNYFNLIFN